MPTKRETASEAACLNAALSAAVDPPVAPELSLPRQLSRPSRFRIHRYHTGYPRVRARRARADTRRDGGRFRRVGAHRAEAGSHPHVSRSSPSVSQLSRAVRVPIVVDYPCMLVVPAVVLRVVVALSGLVHTSAY
jgi:hypothetical protein